MQTKNTTKQTSAAITQTDKNLIEEVIARYGRIVSFRQVYALRKSRDSVAETRNRVSHLSKKGWFVRLKKGLYLVITDLASLASEDISGLSVAQALNKNSYVSFENALQYHGMFDQMLSSVSSVTAGYARSYKVKNGQFRFFKIKKSLYFGFARERADIGIAHIAHAEKALLDILYFRSNAYYAGLVWETFRQYKKTLDFARLSSYALKFGQDIIRQTGFFMDILDKDTSKLAASIKGKKSYSRMTKEAKEFNAKWRLFVDRSVIEQA